ncbi:MAG: hypothetical protein ACE5KW_05655, partial [Dehalococcoidia bacterium]
MFYIKSRPIQRASRPRPCSEQRTEAVVFPSWQALAAGEVLASALCGAFNAAYFIHFLASRREEPAARRVAAAALALLNLGAAVESLSFFALISPLVSATPSSLPWVLIRALPFAGTASISLLILRRLHYS